jgi:uncharacterized protein (DUF58 family)
MTSTARFSAALFHPWKTLFQARTGRVAGSAWIELQPHRIFILPTRAGLGFAGLLLVMLLGAINYSNNLIFALTFLLAGLGLVTMLHTYRNLSHLELRAGQGRPGFVGERLGYQVWLRPGDGRPRQAIWLRAGSASALTPVPLKGDAVWLHLEARQRGPLPLGMVTISSSYPLGLFRTWSRVVFTHSELAYPTPAPPGPPPPTLAEGKHQSGSQQAGPEDFRGLRNYRPGDSLRHVHWKALAREQGLLTKEFGSDQARSCWLDFASTPEQDSEARLRRLCRWILEAERAQLNYGLRIPDLVISPARGNAHRDRCLAALATFAGPG